MKREKRSDFRFKPIGVTLPVVYETAQQGRHYTAWHEASFWATAQLPSKVEYSQSAYRAVHAGACD